VGQDRSDGHYEGWHRSLNARRWNKAHAYGLCELRRLDEIVAWRHGPSHRLPARARSRNTLGSST
jgi:hypothetical protein